MDWTSVILQHGPWGAFAVMLIFQLRSNAQMAARLDHQNETLLGIAKDAVHAQDNMADAIKGNNAVTGKLAGSVYRLSEEMRRRPCGDESRDVADVSRQSAQVAAGS